MSNKAEKHSEDGDRKDQYVTIEGIVTSGDVKSKALILYLGEGPKKSCLIIRNEIIPCRRIEVIVDWETPVTIANFDCDFVPEEDKL
jgi:hypothetical protein